MCCSLTVVNTFIFLQHSEFHLTVVQITLQRVWVSSTLSASSHSQLFEFSLLRLHSLGQKYILWVRRQIPSKSANQKFPVNWRGERGISWKAEPSIHPCPHEKGSWQTKRYKATEEVSSIDEQLLSTCDYLFFIVDLAIFAYLWIQEWILFCWFIRLGIREGRGREAPVSNSSIYE